MGSHVEDEHGPFIKQVNHVNPNMTQTHLASTHDLFINRLVVSCLRVVSDFDTSICNWCVVGMKMDTWDWDHIEKRKKKKKKRNQQQQPERRNKSCERGKKKSLILTLTSRVISLKRKRASCLNFIGEVWSGA